MQKRWFIPLLCIFSFSLMASDDVDIDNEILRLKKELAQVSKQRKKVRKAAKEDKKEFSQYQKRTKERFSVLAAETDSVRKEVGVLNKKSAALGSTLYGLEARQKNLDLKQKGLQKKLVDLCKAAIEMTKAAPPLLSKKSADGLDFLKSELAVGSIDNIEGMERLVKIINDLDVQLMNIEIAQGASPIPQIQGNVYRLRVGGVFEASVDIKGTKCAIWNTDKWVFVDDEGVASEILEAVMIREGKALPAFVKLPYTVADEGGTNAQ